MKCTFKKGILLLGLLQSSLLYGQQSLNLCGHTAKIEGIEFNYSIGEMTLVHTARNSNMIVTQGFLQPYQIFKLPSGSNLLENSYSLLNTTLKVYPNPTTKILNLESDNQVAVNIHYQLMNTSGSFVLGNTANWNPGHNKLSIDVANLAAGCYVLTVQKADLAGLYEHFAFKINKQ